MALRNHNETDTVDVLNHFEKCVYQRPLKVVGDLDSPLTVFGKLLFHAMARRNDEIRVAQARLYKIKKQYKESEEELSQLRHENRRIEHSTTKLNANINLLYMDKLVAEDNHKSLIASQNKLVETCDKLEKNIVETIESNEQKAEIIGRLDRDLGKTLYEAAYMKKQMARAVEDLANIDMETSMVERRLMKWRWEVLGNLNDMQWIAENEFNNIFIESLQAADLENAFNLANKRRNNLPKDKSESQIRLRKVEYPMQMLKGNAIEEDHEPISDNDNPWKKLKWIFNQSSRFLYDKAMLIFPSQSSTSVLTTTSMLSSYSSNDESNLSVS